MTPVADLQRAIDALDDEIIERLARRFAHSREIGEAKRRLGQPPYDPERIRSQQDRFVLACVDHGLDVGMARQIIAVIGAQVLVERLENFRSPPGPGPKP